MNSIESMFDSEIFREHGHALIDLLATHLAGNLAGSNPVLRWQAPAEADRHWQQPLPQQPTHSAADFLHKLSAEILPDSLAVHHPRNLGHQVAPPLPMAALCDLVAALTNQAMAVYETGPSATLMERQVIRWMAELIGWNNAAGILTSGGAQANLTALLAARQVKAGRDVWHDGIASSAPCFILASEHAHYSVSRAAGIMGLGTQAVVSIAADTQGRMELADLQHQHQKIVQRGARVIAVVATAGCTPTGSIDPLPAIGAYCKQHDLWLHVDGAHGASALLSRQHREQVSGIELADSVVWDGHKLLYMPAAVSAVIFRNPAHSYAAFAQQASYLFNGNNSEEETYNTSYRTLECTKRMMSLKLWAAFSLYGVEGLGRLVERVFSTARSLAERLDQSADFVLLMPPQTNIVCFRYGDGDQSAIRQRLIESGAFHITQVNLHDKIWLRTTVMNPFTTERDLDALLEQIKTITYAPTPTTRPR